MLATVASRAAASFRSSSGAAGARASAASATPTSGSSTSAPITPFSTALPIARRSARSADPDFITSALRWKTRCIARAVAEATEHVDAKPAQALGDRREGQHLRNTPGGSAPWVGRCCAPSAHPSSMGAVEDRYAATLAPPPCQPRWRRRGTRSSTSPPGRAAWRQMRWRRMRAAWWQRRRWRRRRRSMSRLWLRWRPLAACGSRCRRRSPVARWSRRWPTGGSARAAATAMATGRETMMARRLRRRGKRGRRRQRRRAGTRRRRRRLRRRRSKGWRRSAPRSRGRSRGRGRRARRHGSSCSACGLPRRRRPRSAQTRRPRPLLRAATPWTPSLPTRRVESGR